MTRVQQTSEWLYRGIWGVLTQWFRVPALPPTLPVTPGERLESFRPSDGFLRYLKFQFWIALVFVDAALTVGWVVLTIARPTLGLLLAPLALVVIVLPDIVAYVAIHLRYDTTWYVLTRRSLRIRRGIWVIHETTITFENIQNVTVDSGPLERWFGIANVLVDTAGGGATKKTSHGEASSSTHRGIIEGIHNAGEIRDLILKRLRQSRSAGLGDETSEGKAGLGPQHVAVLREIRDALRHHRGAANSVTRDDLLDQS
jgi:membrane protein YdbS with pleckstrin-like domain